MLSFTFISDFLLSTSIIWLYFIPQVWDLRMDGRPTETYAVHEHLRSKLCALYENDCIFDKFECSWSRNDQ